MFWTATYRKIYAVLEVDRQVNDPKSKKKKRPAIKPKGEKISLEEALKRF